MQEIICAVCHKKTKYKILFPQSFNHNTIINAKIYSSRRKPDRIHFRIVRCLNCGLTYSNPIFEQKKIINFYRQSFNPKEQDINSSAKIYASYLKLILPRLKAKEKLLDIGCGDGFFLREAKKMGFKEVYGVEPSLDAVKNLQKGIDKKKIVAEVFKKGQFKDNFFDVVCFFQVLDHVLDPNEFLSECFKILKPGGFVLAIMHDTKSLTATILGERSPIFDIQHIYLFDKKTIKEIFQNNGFVVDRVFNIYNKYTLGYWLKMMPIHYQLKIQIQKFLPKKITEISIPLKIGNMAIIAHKTN